MESAKSVHNQYEESTEEYLKRLNEKYKVLPIDRWCYWFFRDNDNKVPNIVSDMKVIWEIVTPIITLALGYAFGRNEK